MTNQTTVMKNAGVISRALVMSLADELQFLNKVSKIDISDYNGKNTFKAGDTIYKDVPTRFIPNTAFDLTSSMNDFTETTVPIVADSPYSIGVSLSSEELAHDIGIESIAQRIVKQAVPSIAQFLEQKMLTNALNATYNCVGTAGSTTFDVATVLSAKTKLNKYLAPKDMNRYLLLESAAGADAVNQRKGLFQSSSQIAEQYIKGEVGRSDGLTWLENELLPTHTNGTATVGGLTVTTTSSEGASTLSITDSGGAAETLTAGTRFTISNVFAVHPITKQKYPFLQQFVVKANATAASGAFTGVTISPAIYTVTSKALQNVDSLPQGSAAITILTGAASTAYQQNLVFHEDAFCFGTLPLDMPKASSVDFVGQASYKGLNLAIVRDFDVYKRTKVTRVDILGAWGVLRPEWMCAITS